MIELTRGISWSVSKYLRHQIGCKFILTGDFIEDNIYQGTKEKTMLCEEIPLSVGKQFPYNKFTATSKITLSNQLSIHSTKAVGFKTKRILTLSDLGGADSAPLLLFCFHTALHVKYVSETK